MTTFTSTLQAFFSERLTQQRNASPHTISSYRDSLKMLLTYASTQTDTPASELDIPTLDAALITRFLQHLETDRGNSIATRNQRLAAIHSLYRYAALRHPEHAAIINRVLAIPAKRHETALLTFLEEHELTALLQACDRDTPTGRRDHSLLQLASETGLRRSELINLTISDLHLGAGAHVRCTGKGRKNRVTPITKHTRATLRAYLKERPAAPTDILFPSRHGTPLSPDALERRLALYVQRATTTQPSLARKRITLHTLRHTAAMRLLHAGIDTSTIAMWLGHENVNTTQKYLHSDLRTKQRALDRTRPAHVPPGRYQPTDRILKFLEDL